MSKKIFVLAICAISLLALSNLAAAAAFFDVEYTPIKDIIQQGEKARFTIDVTNKQEVLDKFKIYTDNEYWSISTDPLYVYQTEYGLDAAANSTGTAKLFFEPNAALLPGIYSINVYLKSKNTGEIIEKNVLITVKSQSGGEYLPAIRVDASVPDNGLIDPREKLLVDVKLDNLNPLNISNLSIAVTSQLFEIERSSALGPLEQKTEQFAIDINPLEAPKKLELTLIVKRQNEILKRVKINIEIKEYSELKTSVEKRTGFLQKRFVYTYTNEGNVNRKEKVSIPTNLFSMLITQTKPKATATSEKTGSALTWYLNLAPMESIDIYITYNYQLIVLIILLVAAAIISYYTFRSPIIIKKEVGLADSAREGISQLKVLIYIKNRTPIQFKNVKLLDKVPNIAEMQDEFIVGTMKPTKVLRNDKRGTIIEWAIQTIEPYEERIVSYKIRSKLSILGFFNLPPAMIKFRHNNKEKSFFSRKVRAAQKQ